MRTGSPLGTSTGSATSRSPTGGMAVAVRVRSTSPPQPATLFPSADGARVLLRDGEYGVAAGQACVFYADAGPEARVLGGGWIGRALSRAEQPDEHGDESRPPVGCEHVLHARLVVGTDEGESQVMRPTLRSEEPAHAEVLQAFQGCRRRRHAHGRGRHQKRLPPLGAGLRPHLRARCRRGPQAFGRDHQPGQGPRARGRRRHRPVAAGLRAAPRDRRHRPLAGDAGEGARAGRRRAASTTSPACTRWMRAT